MLRVHEGKPKKIKKRGGRGGFGGIGENANKRRERGKRENTGEEGWWGQPEGSQRATYGSDSVITANL